MGKLNLGENELPTRKTYAGIRKYTRFGEDEVVKF